MSLSRTACTLFSLSGSQTKRGDGVYVELPYTLHQDLTLLVLLQHGDTHLWKEKLEWIADKGWMALVISHPDYMKWPGAKKKVDEYAFELYREFLDHVKATYKDLCWNEIPRD